METNNKAPEKIYIQSFNVSEEEAKFDKSKMFFDDVWTEEPERGQENIEYTRTDTFIEKALVYLNEKFYFNNLHYAIENNTFNCMEEMFEDFRNHMKGERSMERYVPKFKIGETIRRDDGHSIPYTIADITEDKYIFSNGFKREISDQNNWITEEEFQSRRGVGCKIYYPYSPALDTY